MSWSQDYTEDTATISSSSELGFLWPRRAAAAASSELPPVTAIPIPGALQRQSVMKQTDPAAALDATLQLIEAWMADDSGYEENAWGALETALDEHRLAGQKLFTD